MKFLTKKNTFSFYVFFFNVIVVSITYTKAAEAGNGSTDSVSQRSTKILGFPKIHKLVKRCTAFLFFRN